MLIDLGKIIWVLDSELFAMICVLVCSELFGFGFCFCERVYIGGGVGGMSGP